MIEQIRNNVTDIKVLNAKLNIIITTGIANFGALVYLLSQ